MFSEYAVREGHLNHIHQMLGMTHCQTNLTFKNLSLYIHKKKSLLLLLKGFFISSTSPSGPHSEHPTPQTKNPQERCTPCSCLQLDWLQAPRFPQSGCPPLILFFSGPISADSLKPEGFASSGLWPVGKGAEPAGN